ncbi:sirohydrochlorin cobaltochelatase [Sporomusa acidovorans]|uniref:Sirohydrochlorin cobaltochelatase n=1 Tax=Sporomusa acidovorans (strain ATCC 49682 / DSM 3132 / Mol) TaxID=1123286 RepID=A0ABZ3J536_SPOA4|nr:sirohydrochlorin cobaltochelatase [Sporomusa acidovorans]OZC23946.1 sirohydrochlorin cobaltochelatase [Sporomusa acidovorans DSM 3132]SDF31833.1 Cobalt chelatase (CbiK) [Sporomusa acidovorans]
MDKTEKRAFLMVGIGTAYQEARRLVTACMENKIRSEYPQYEIRQAFASRTVIEKLAEIDGIQVDSERQALERLQAEGFTEVIVQPFQIFAGDEYEQVKAIVQGYGAANGFDKTEFLPCLTFWIKQESRTIN